MSISAIYIHIFGRNFLICQNHTVILLPCEYRLFIGYKSQILKLKRHHHFISFFLNIIQNKSFYLTI